MSKYLLEIRNRTIFLCIVGFSMLFINYLYKETLLFLLIESEVFANNEFKVYYFIFTDVAEVFSVYLNLIVFISLQVLWAYLLYYYFSFITYGLYATEYYYLQYFIKTIFSVWLFSIIISKYFLIPIMWDFFINFQKASFLNLHFEARLSEYLDFYTKFYYVFILYCQIFSLLFFFFKYVNADSILVKKFRKLYYYFFVVFSTLVSPPDVISQILISLVLVFCYEIFVLIFLFKNKVNFLIRKPIKTY